MKALTMTIGLLLLICFAPGARADGGRPELERAFQVSSQASFACRLDNPFPADDRETVYIPYAPEWQFYRSYHNGRLELRLDALKGGRAVESYVRNEYGIYGRIHDGFAAEIIEVPSLWFLELTHLEIGPEEMDAASFEMQNVTCHGVPCYKITMRTPDEDDEEFRQNRVRYRTQRVFTREFWGGRRDSLIYCRKHYDRSGKVIFSVELGEVDPDADLPASLFAIPDGVQGKFIERNFFISKALEKMIAADLPSAWTRLSGWFSYWGNRLFWNNFNGIIAWSSRVLAVLGAGIIVWVAAYKIRARRHGRPARPRRR